MSIAAVVTRGYGSFGSPSFVVVLGYGGAFSGGVIAGNRWKFRSQFERLVQQRRQLVREEKETSSVDRDIAELLLEQREIQPDIVESLALVYERDILEKAQDYIDNLPVEIQLPPEPEEILPPPPSEMELLFAQAMQLNPTQRQWNPQEYAEWAASWALPRDSVSAAELYAKAIQLDPDRRIWDADSHSEWITNWARAMASKLNRTH